MSDKNTFFVLISSCVVPLLFSIPPWGCEIHIHEFHHGVHRTTQPDKHCVIHSGHSRAPFTLRNPHFQTCLTSRSLQPVTSRCRLLWHSITPPVPAIAKVPNWGMIGHSSLPPIGRFGPVKRAGCAVWNEMVSTFDSSHVDGATGPALSDSIQFGSYTTGSL